MDTNTLVTLVTNLEILVKFVGIITGITLLWKKIIKPIIEMFKAKKRRDEKLDKIVKELQNNGGFTVKDGIDILKTATVRIESTLYDMQESQRVFYELQDTAFWVSDETGACIYASKALCEIYERPPEELKGNNWAAWLHPKDKIVFDVWENCVSHNMIFNCDFTIVKPDGLLQNVKGYAVHKQKNGLYCGSMGKIKPVGEPYESEH